MNGFVTASTPTGALVEERSMVLAADQEAAARLGLLEMAFQAQVGIALHQHFGVDTPMRGMAGGATFAQGIVLEDKRPLLRGMALQAVVVLRP